MIAGRFETEIVVEELQSRPNEIAGRVIREAIACKNRQTHRHSQGRPEPRHPRQQKITHARASLKARKNKKTAQEEKAVDRIGRYGSAQKGAEIVFAHATCQRPIAMSENGRSEEHTSELQSLMRISYAVFCLKK